MVRRAGDGSNPGNFPLLKKGFARRVGIVSSEQGWVRYGFFRDRNDAWKTFSSLLLSRLPGQNRDTAELSHAEMAVQAYNGSCLSTGNGKKNLYDFLGLKFEPSSIAQVSPDINPAGGVSFATLPRPTGWLPPFLPPHFIAPHRHSVDH
jgi:hypothetical protein